MNPVFFGLLLLDALALWAIILSKKAAWWLVFGAIILVFSVNFLTINAFNSGAGWPAKALPGADNVFLGCDVVEPDPVAHSPGAVYLWAVPLKRQHDFIGYSSTDRAPRSFQEPYSRQLEIECAAAQKALGQGVAVAVGAKGKKHGQGRPSPYGQRGGKLHFYHLPPVNAPRKGH